MITPELDNYKNENGEFLIPVEWSVYSTIKVKADNLGEAVRIAQEKLDDIPLCRENEYIDGSYKLNGESDEDFINAQQYRTVGDVTIEKDGSITTD